MANITEQAIWEEGVREVGQGEPVTGGVTGTVNLSLQDLANRTAWLKQRCTELEASISALESDTEADLGLVLKKANNLSDVADVPTARKNLGISTLKETLQTIYPVGAIYISTNETSPATLFGFGTWEQIQGRFIVGAGAAYAPEDIGGEDKHTLTVNELPTHEHAATTNQSGSHSHSGSAASAGAHYHGAMGEINTKGPFGTYDARNIHMGSNGGTDYDNPLWKTSTDGAHTHTVTINSGGAHAHAITVKSTGGGVAHNNLPPYFAAYIWRRTA